MDRAAYFCQRYRKAPAASVIASIIAQTRPAYPSALIRVEAIKRAWQSAGNIEFSKWMEPAKLGQWITCVSALAPTVTILWDTSRALNGINLVSGEGSWALLFTLYRDLPLLVFGLILALLGFTFGWLVSSRADRLKLEADDVAIDFIVNYLGMMKRRHAMR